MLSIFFGGFILCDDISRNASLMRERSFEFGRGRAGGSSAGSREMARLGAATGETGSATTIDDEVGGIAGIALGEMSGWDAVGGLPSARGSKEAGVCFPPASFVITGESSVPSGSGIHTSSQSDDPNVQSSWISIVGPFGSGDASVLASRVRSARDLTCRLRTIHIATPPRPIATRKRDPRISTKGDMQLLPGRLIVPRATVTCQPH